MIDAARAWAVRRHVSNVEFRVIPDERRLGVPPGSFDAATCRAGIQYMPEREAAARAVRDALRPGGRFVVMTLGAPALCQPFTLTNDVVARHAELPWRDPDDPGPVGLSTVEQLAEILVAAGFVDVKTETLISPIFEADSPAEAWRLFTETAGPFMELLASLDRQRRRALDRDAVAAFAAAFPGGRVRPTGQALIACGVKPA
jgi:SAM-dependent methyltransferase